MTFCSVQVRPLRKYRTGQGPSAACGGKKTPSRMVTPSASESWLQTSWVPPKQALDETRSIEDLRSG